MKNKRKRIEKKDLPGYPHYPQSEDILNNAKRIDSDPENLSSSNKHDPSEFKKIKTKDLPPDASPEIVRGTSADVTKDDLKMLGRRDRDLDEGEDELLLPGLEIGPDLSGDDLDVPGSELDDDEEDIGSEDEENNFYSRGQD